MSPHSAIVFVQGAFQGPQFYATFVDKLRTAGYDVHHPILPTASDTDASDFPQRTLSDDARVVRETVQKLVNQGRTVHILMHSYGGLVGSEAVTKDLTLESRKANSQPGGVIDLLFVAAFALNRDASVLGTFGASPNDDVKPDGRYYFIDPKPKLFSDLPEAEQEIWAKQTLPHSYIVQSYPITNAAWEFLPSKYIITSEDKTCPPQAQEMLAGMIKAQQIERIPTGHEPNLSNPDLLVQKVLGLLSK